MDSSQPSAVPSGDALPMNSLEDADQQVAHPPVAEVPLVAAQTPDDIVLFEENLLTEPPPPTLLDEDFTAVAEMQCLTTISINWAQHFLKRNYPVNGFLFTDFFLFQKGYKVDPPFVNILFLKTRSHFVCISTVGCETGRVKVFDSYRCDRVCEELRMQVECLYGGACEIEMVKVQQQRECECGVFAIAFSVCVVNGLDPEFVKFKRDSMRDHLLKCMKDDCLSLLPMY